jgi:hypothetical protein
MADRNREAEDTLSFATVFLPRLFDFAVYYGVVELLNPRYEFALNMLRFRMLLIAGKCKSRLPLSRQCLVSLTEKAFANKEFLSQFCAKHGLGVPVLAEIAFVRIKRCRGKTEAWNTLTSAVVMQHFVFRGLGVEPMTFINDHQIERDLAIVSEMVQHSLCTEDNLAFFAAAELLPVTSHARLFLYMMGDKPGFSGIDPLS